jgi:hypothetical protein
MTNSPLRLPVTAPLLAVLIAASGLAACSSPLVCTSELRVALSPTDTTLRVAQELEPSLRLASCGGRQSLPVRIALSSSDTNVVRIEPGAHRVRAVGPGTAQVIVTDSTYGHVGDVHIVVTPSP